MNAADLAELRQRLGEAQSEKLRLERAVTLAVALYTEGSEIETRESLTAIVKRWRVAERVYERAWADLRQLEQTVGVRR